MKGGSVFQRYKCLFISAIALIVIAAIVLGVVFGVVIPNNNNNNSLSSKDDGNSIKDNSQKPTTNNDNIEEDDAFTAKMNIFTKPNLKEIPKGLGSFDDSKQANEYSVPLNEEFPYKEKKIRGVNLGGWLVPEPFIVPSLYSNHTRKPVEDEWKLCTELGKKKCQEVLTKHYNTFITEKDIQRIAKAGLNHVRIPIGYWMFDNTEDEPFVYGSFMYLLRSIQWCRKYGLRVMLDFHAVPGSQNGWNHSGRAGDIRFLNKESAESSANEKRFLKILEEVAVFFNKKEFRNVVVMIGVINEPNTFVTKDFEAVTKFYQDSYKLIRNATGGESQGPMISYHDAFGGLPRWAKELPSSKYSRVVMDAHNYIAFDPNFSTAKHADVIKFPCAAWRESFAESNKHFLATVAAEFSLAPNDCGLNLNGVGNGSKYDGTFFDAKPACSTCKCEPFVEYKTFTKEYKAFLKAFVEAQFDAFEAGSGWFFWTYRTEDGVNPGWDYSLGLENGWIPKDAGVRETYCKDLI